MRAGNYYYQLIQLLRERSLAIKIDRLRSIDGEIMLFVQTYLPYDLCPDLVDLDLSNCSLYALLRERYDLAVTSGRRTVEAVAAQVPLTRLLQVEKARRCSRSRAQAILPMAGRWNTTRHGTAATAASSR